MKRLIITSFLIACFALTSYAQDTLQNKKENQKPKVTYTVGSARVTVWENAGKYGTWKNFKIEKIYMKDDELKTSSSFNESELLELKAAIDKAILEEQVVIKKAPDKQK